MTPRMPALATIAVCGAAAAAAGCIPLPFDVPKSPVPTPSADAAAPPAGPATRFAVPVAVYYSPETRAAVSRDASGDFGNMVASDVGPSTVELFDRVLGNLFAAVAQAPGRSPAPGQPAVLEVRVADAKLARGWTMTAAITYVFTLRDARGEIARWSVTGNGGYGRSLHESMPSRAAKATSLALEDAAGQFARGLTQQPGIAAWLAAHPAPAPERTEGK